MNERRSDLHRFGKGTFGDTNEIYSLIHDLEVVVVVVVVFVVVFVVVVVVIVVIVVVVVFVAGSLGSIYCDSDSMFSYSLLSTEL